MNKSRAGSALLLFFAGAARHRKMREIRSLLLLGSDFFNDSEILDKRLTLMP
jgi:hypothetical protein